MFFYLKEFLDITIRLVTLLIGSKEFADGLIWFDMEEHVQFQNIVVNHEFHQYD